MHEAAEPGAATREISLIEALEMLSERLIDDLCDGQAVEVRLAPDGLDPAALDVEGCVFNAFQVQ